MAMVMLQLEVDDTNDLAQATGGQPVCVNVGNGNATDSCSGKYLYAWLWRN